MKLATGQYVNVYSEYGYDNCGTTEQLDIFIILAESADELTIDDVDDIQDRVEKVVREKGPRNLKRNLAKEFEDYEFQIVVNKL